ncbi:hypothetical protein DRQ25_00885 [Candidatus Fermentibacteria bacterium]|nr:MAG: hypothetical protein DRQ25_00885 [Candidatus Fermentibacteria bacterium]
MKKEILHFTIQGELTELNTYTKKNRSSKFAGSKIKKEETDRVALEAKAARIKPVVNYPVFIQYRWYSKDRRKDIDNVAFAKKFINDGLVVAGVLKDDSRKCVRGFSDYFFIDKKNPRVEVYIIFEDM